MKGSKPRLPRNNAQTNAARRKSPTPRMPSGMTDVTRSERESMFNRR
jgi:hypothetical protein